MIQLDIIKKIEEYETIIIHHHVSPDPDCVGSQMGLKHIIEESYPEKKVYVVGEESERIAFLGKLDQIPDDIYERSLVIIVDVGDKPRIADDRWAKGKELIKIDHHPLTEEFADLEWVDTSFAAAAEMIVDLYVKSDGKLKMNVEAARALYSGILTDTGRFYYSSVSERTLRYGAQLYKFDFDKQDLYKDVYYRSVEDIKFKGYIESSFEYTEHGLGYMKFDQELLDRFDIEAGTASGMVNTLSNLKEIICWIFFTEDKDLGKIRVGFRSRGPIVNTLAAKYGGGGHNWASGTLAPDWETVEKIIEDANNLCKEFNNNF
ncbi:DHH family phosphoesterase [Haloplasma contractile]|uniref:tRNA nucleotidyltransferase CCA-adding enzyme protein n=1 Tax=Haloplasma contractile SSD-17B TaxID=1033810 RepID=U2FLH8_9MOLU|nr:bifunctional oligoribonuclease/PAP phosphatase NrnA [Haloplasma contractile]ERJ13600.1 tRNA nucleotidyltransferase CCA-adding enzyme protein [Haloplasma contractile SSD-17B]